MRSIGYTDESQKKTFEKLSASEKIANLQVCRAMNVASQGHLAHGEYFNSLRDKKIYTIIEQYFSLESVNAMNKDYSDKGVLPEIERLKNHVENCIGSEISLKYMLDAASPNFTSCFHVDGGYNEGDLRGSFTIYGPHTMFTLDSRAFNSALSNNHKTCFQSKDIGYNSNIAEHGNNGSLALFNRYAVHATPPDNHLDLLRKYVIITCEECIASDKLEKLNENILLFESQLEFQGVCGDIC